MTRTYDLPEAGFGWAWIDGEDDDRGNAWIQIGSVDADGSLADEMAIIMCRDFESVKVQHPEWVAFKESDAQRIVDALNAAPAPGDPEENNWL